MLVGEAILLAFPALAAGGTLVAVCAPDWFAALRWALVHRVLPAVGICLGAAGALYGLLVWATTYRPLHEEHVIDEYRLEFTSEQSPKLENPDSVLVRVYRDGELVAGPMLIGFTRTKSGGLFTVRRLPHESLIIACPRQSERNVVFVYDTATGEHWPERELALTENEQTRQVEYGNKMESRIRAGLGDNRYGLSTFWPSHSRP